MLSSLSTEDEDKTMITSMTGFGRGSAEGESGSVGVEVRSVNSRFLDIQVRSPHQLQAFEQVVREKVQGRVARGKISVHISWEEGASVGSLPTLDETVVARYIDDMRRLAAMDGVRGEVEVDRELLVRLPGVFRSEVAQGDNEEAEGLLTVALAAALDDFVAMRTREGETLAADLRTRVERIEALLAEVEKCVPEVRKQVHARLREKVADLLKPGEVDEARLAMEVALIADRSDITEEIVRFHSHNDQFAEALDKGGEVGRRFNFLLQEMNREANTISSKAANSEIVHTVLEIKEEVERLREQVQNLS
ncbi:MAG: hypothetical protein ACI906_003307 [Candidatus Latescibacterota bacterium]|jgi:uncharacterized protein (TIGR00255 family)